MVQCLDVTYNDTHMKTHNNNKNISQVRGRTLWMQQMEQMLLESPYM